MLQEYLLIQKESHNIWNTCNNSGKQFSFIFGVDAKCIISEYDIKFHKKLSFY